VRRDRGPGVLRLDAALVSDGIEEAVAQLRAAL
jgi:hypothetical protein